MLLKILKINKKKEVKKAKIQKRKNYKKLKEKRRIQKMERDKPIELWQHQKDAIEKAKKLNHFGFLFEVGCGKSAALIRTFQNKYEKNNGLNTIIFCPLVVIENLKNEFEKFGDIPQKFIVTLKGSMKERISTFNKYSKEKTVFITNYEAIYNDPFVQALISWPIEAIICDEMHKLKDPASKRTKTIIRLSKFADYKYGLSGTPILNSQLDIFAQALFLDGGKAFGENFFIFRSKYFYDANANRKGTQGYFPNWVPRPGINQELQKRIEPFTARALKKDSLDLPPLLRKEIICALGHEQEKTYNQMKDDFIAFLNDKACVAELALTKALRLQQIVSGFIKVEDNQNEIEIKFKENPRIEILKKTLEDILPSKVIVWAVFKRNYEMIEAVCKELSVKYSMLHGETKDKQKEIDVFQNDDSVKVMIANPAAGGIGINLTAANYMVYYSKSFSLEQELQSEARCYRGGSEIHEKITRIDIVAKDTIDEAINKILKKKKEIGVDVLDNNEIIKILKTI